MSDRARRNRVAISLVIVSLVALGGVSVLLGAGSMTARAATCDQGGGIITGDWTITTAQVCSGIRYTVDGNITINSGGSLTLVNGGLSFFKDTKHESYALTVNAGGALTLDNSIVTVETNAIDPFLKLALTVSGATLTMQNGAVLKFPGWFNATGATISMSDSAITGFLPGEISSTGVYVPDNDNAPLLSWSSTTASLFQSQIARIYENTTASTGTNVTGPIEGNLSLTGGSNLYAYDSYLGVDFSNVFGLHNELQVDATSNAYLYNVTIDQSENPVVQANWKPAYVPAPGGNIYLLRWFRVSVVDSTGFPVSGATIWSVQSPTATTAQYPDNSLGTTPTARTLGYLGRTASGASAWNTTDSNGYAVIPLYTDLITSASLPNAASFGNYQVTASFSAARAVAGVNFNPYPAVAWQDNSVWATIPLTGVSVRTGPDLALHPSDYPGTLSVLEGQPFTVSALIYNQGQTTATGVSIAAFLDGNRSAQVARVNGLTVVSFVNETMNVTGLGVTGAHTLELIVDPDNTINEGGPVQESNNFANITLNVLPPPAGFVAILAPSSGLSVQPGTSLSVTGYVRDTSSRPIVGVTLTVQLLSGSTVLATNTTKTDGSGFFLGTVTVPAGQADGSYTVSVTSSATTIQSDSRTIDVHTPASFLNTPVPLLGIQWWLFLIILAIIVAAAVGITLYFKVYGLGKMVECGECGAFIPEDATVCPKCGVEFEKDMAKCSNCSAWIPVDVKQCPECGVEFATGELDMADYQEKMRLQYDEVVQKLKQDASRQLGRSLSDQEFQEWWRRQPTFLTFEDWLKEEEAVRKEGSKACPSCSTLNSINAKVCHTCGTLMRPLVAQPTRAGATKVGAPKRAVRPPPATPPPPEAAEEETAPPSGPQAAGPVVQKKVIRRTPAEGEDTGTDDQTQGGDSL